MPSRIHIDRKFQRFMACISELTNNNPPDVEKDCEVLGYIETDFVNKTEKFIPVEEHADAQKKQALHVA